MIFGSRVDLYIQNLSVKMKFPSRKKSWDPRTPNWAPKVTQPHFWTNCHNFVFLILVKYERKEEIKKGTYTIWILKQAHTVDHRGHMRAPQ